MARTQIGVIFRPDEPGDPTGLVTEQDLADHVEADTPHPAYDDNMNLIIYLENGLA